MNDMVTKRIIMCLIVVMVFSVCATIIIKTNRDAACNSRASDTTTEGIDEKALYGIDLSGETEYTIDEDIDITKYNYDLPSNTDNGAILYAWCWSFDTISDNLDSIAKSGFCAVQTSPVNEIYVGEDGGMHLYGKGKWYFQEQNTDWTIGNYQLGTQKDLENLCAEADEYGIKIIVEVSPNCVASDISCVSEKLINAFGGKDNLYHKTGEIAIKDYTDRQQVTSYKICNYPDADTENTGFQDYFITFLQDCISIGVDGFRFDEAESIALEDDPAEKGVTNNFWNRIKSEVLDKEDIFAYGDISTKFAGRPAEYAKTIGNITSRTYSARLRTYIRTWNLDAKTFVNPQVNNVDMSNLVLTCEEADTYIYEVYDDFSDYQIKVGWALIAARAKGIPLFFSRPKDGGAVYGIWGSVNQIGKKGSSLYEDPEVMAVNRFRNAMIGEDENIFNPDDNIKIVAIERGKKGILFVNMGGEYEINLDSKLDDGLYLNQTDDDSIFRVENGKLKGTLPKESIVVLYMDSENAVNIPMINVKSAADIFYSDETTVTLCVDRAEHATFSLGGKEYEFENGKQLKFGKTMKYNDSISITLKAITKDGVVNKKTYTFTKKDETQKGTYVKFIRPDDWANTIYVYNFSGIDNMYTLWPGVLMEYMGNGTYIYQIPAGWENSQLIFTDSINQYPEIYKGGLSVVSGRMYSPDLDEYQKYK